MVPGVPDPITSSDLRLALGWTLSTFYRARKAGRVPEPTSTTPGGHARWSVREAVRLVRAEGRPVPGAWLGDSQHAAA